MSRHTSLVDLLYSPLKEEEEKLTGWSKSTIEYVLNNKSTVHTSIRGIAKGLNKILQRSDVEDLYMEVLQYLYTCDDYNISKAYERSSNAGVVVSLEGYVHSCVKFVVIRIITDKYKKVESHEMSTYVKDNDNKERSIIDSIPSNSEMEFSDFGYNLESMCKFFESQRYSYGPDIFQIWFVRLQTMLYNKADSYKEILSVLGISKREIAAVEKQIVYDGAMTSIAKAISLTGIEKAVEIIKKYTYSADRITRVIELF